MEVSELIGGVVETTALNTPEGWLEFTKRLLNLKFTKNLVTNVFNGFNEKERIADEYVVYKEKLISHHSTTKSLLYKNSARNLYDHYVDIDLEYINKTPINKRRITITTESSENLFRYSNKALIIGTAGSGKTTLIKHFFLNSMANEANLPIFFELKNLNKMDRTTPNLLKTSILADMESKGLHLNITKLSHLLRSDNVYVFLDGFDEVAENIRKKIIKEINDLTLENCTIVVTSRPSSNSFINFEKLTEFHVKPLRIEQSDELVRSLCESDSIEDFEVERFLADIKANHSVRDSFMLSNPLMITILMLAYSEDSRIPEKSYLIYESAYNALFSNHDSAKGFFNRKKYSNLGKDDLNIVLRYLSAYCYFDNKEGFESTKEFNTYLNDVQKNTEIKFGNSKLMEDLIESVCIILKEGDVYEYVHKSFLEYFTAEFMIYEEFLDNDELYETIKSLDITSENRVFEFMYEMNRKKLLEIFIKPYVQKIENNHLNSGNTIDDRRQFFQKYLGQIKLIKLYRSNQFVENPNMIFEEGYGWGVGISRDFRFVEVIYETMLKYGDIKRIDEKKVNQLITVTIKKLLNKYNTQDIDVVDSIDEDEEALTITLNSDVIFNDNSVYSMIDPILSEHYERYKAVTKYLKRQTLLNNQSKQKFIKRIHMR